MSLLKNEKLTRKTKNESKNRQKNKQEKNNTKETTNQKEKRAINAYHHQKIYTTVSLNETAHNQLNIY